MNQAALREGSLQDPPLQVSKWSRIQMLLDPAEMQELFEEMGEAFLYATGIVASGEEGIAREEFLEQYRLYVEDIRRGESEEEVELSSLMRRCFSGQISVDSDALCVIPMEDGRQMVRPTEPVLQWQPHCFTVDLENARVHSAAFAKSAVSWGLQLSYPQLYLKVGEGVIQLNDRSNQPNTALFRSIQKWVRRHTVPVPLMMNGQRHNLPIRVGKRALEWAGELASLGEQGVSLG